MGPHGPPGARGGGGCVGGGGGGGTGEGVRMLHVMLCIMLHVLDQKAYIPPLQVGRCLK